MLGGKGKNWSKLKRNSNMERHGRVSSLEAAIDEGKAKRKNRKQK
jgi:hypothetical protein